MAHIEKRIRADGKPSYRVIVSRGLNGQRITRTFSRKHDAQAFARKQEGDDEALRASADSLAARKSLDEAIERHLMESTARNKSKPYQLAWWSQRYGNLRLTELGEAHLAEGIEELRQDGRSGATINRYISALSAVLRDAVGWRWAARNPVRNLRRMPESKGRTRWLDEKERARLFEAIDELAADNELPAWFRPWVLLLITTGMRRGEATSLTWGDVDLDRGAVYVKHTKTGEPRTAPLMPEVAAALKTLQTPGHPLPAMPVFPMRSPYEPDPCWKKVKELAGIVDCRMHDLRHTAASILAQSNASDLTIAALLGHSTLAMVKRYSHHRTDAIREQMERAWKG